LTRRLDHRQRKSRGESLQRRYYAETASAYADLHDSDVEHTIALEYISMLMHGLGVRRVLDVGAGTGRVHMFLSRRSPWVSAVGVEPVMALISQAVQRNGVPPGSLVNAVGEDLPFRDASFDAIVATAVLHHTPNPQRVIAEMTRTARKAIFLSDKNRFAYGPIVGRVAKLGLWKAGLWHLAYAIKTKGKGYSFGRRDGVVYSYSVFDSYEQLDKWADRVFFIPLGPVTGRSVFHPLLTSGNVLLCAIRDPD
jgi:SAM-dependent methyltransferase